MVWCNLDELKSFDELKKMKRVDLSKELVADNSTERIKKFVADGACDFKFSYAGRQVDDNILEVLQKLSDEANLIEKYKLLLDGEYVNTGENRMVLHHLTRGQLGADVFEGAENKRQFYENELNKIKALVEDIHSGKILSCNGKTFTDVVQIGIGGSDLGPRAMYLALKNWANANNTEKMQAHFISNVDPDDCVSVLESLKSRLAQTIFILVSKSGTTQETLANEMLVKTTLKKAGLDPAKQMLTVTSCTSPLAKSNNYLQAFFMDDHIGGRYSSTSVCGGVVLSLAFGFSVFSDFLLGANAYDKIALEKNILKNPTLLDALIGVYESSVLDYESTAVLPYSQGLSKFPAHLQQLDMESNGKTVNRFGKPVSYKTGPVLLGEPGTNGQHSFYQLLHQGSRIVPLQFVGFKKSQMGVDVTVDNSSNQKKLNANLVAQIIAFACGKKVDGDNLNKNFAGNRPSSLLFNKGSLTPKALGALLSHFENKVMFQGFLWNLNSFDQEGVQLGKKLTNAVLSGDADKNAQAYIEVLDII
ncbi:MAG: glucose-6-phosphate isomerase [Treponema sp.]|nr:MAG: glucose-6-phosphate isomerase [Treponema sp.]